jgi:stage II sporulation protein D
MKIKSIFEIMDSRLRGNDIVDGRLELTKVVIIGGFGIVFFLLLCVFPVGCRREVHSGKAELLQREQPIKIKVLLVKSSESIEFKSETPVKLSSNKSSVAVNFPAFENSIRIHTDDGNINFAGWGCPGDTIVIETEDSKSSVNGQIYRGRIEIHLSDNAKCIDVINSVGLESYLAGVIAEEMPSYWEYAALQAQTIAARSYALFSKKNHSANRKWDVRKNQASQVYGGVKAETPNVIRIINKSWGKTLFYKSQNSGKSEVLPAYYSSICGGHTESSKTTFNGKYIAPLRGVKCPYCKKIVDEDFFFWKEFVIDKETLSQKLIENYPSLKRLKNITDIEIRKKEKRNGFARILYVTVKGSNGEKGIISSENFRLTLDSSGMNFRSTIFEIAETSSSWIFKNGKGFGHGVGLCQYGAQQMAREGKNYKQILNHYYPGAKIKDVYKYGLYQLHFTEKR